MLMIKPVFPKKKNSLESKENQSIPFKSQKLIFRFKILTLYISNSSRKFRLSNQDGEFQASFAAQCKIKNYFKILFFTDKIIKD